MGEREQGGMLRTVVVVGLVALIAAVIIYAVIGLSGHMKSTTNSASDGIQKEIKNVNGGVEKVTDDYDTSNHKYTFDDTNKTAVIGPIKSGEAKDKGSVVVPSYVTHSGVKYTVVRIGENAYYNSPELTDVVIPDTIKSIELDAFGFNGKLTNVTIGKGVETIGDYAFEHTALSSVTVPDNVKTIGSDVFSTNTHLTNVTIGKGVETIGGYAFWRTALSSVTIPDNVKTIGESAFSNNTHLTNVTIGKGVETIGGDAFSNTSLSSVTIPDNVKTIEQSAFGRIPNSKDGFVSIGKDTTYNKNGHMSSFGSYQDSTGTWIGYKPTIRN